MRIKLIKATLKIASMTILVVMLSGCAGNASAQEDGGLVQGQTAGDSGLVQGQTTGDDGTMQNQGTGDSSRVQNQSPGENGAGDAASNGLSTGSGTSGNGGAGASGRSQSTTGGIGDVYYLDDLYAKEENILPITQSASAGGISCEIEKVEYTESFGDRNGKHLNIFTPGANTDSQGNLPEGFQYLFLTITFTNTTDQPQEIVRTGNDISAIGDSLAAIPWTADACYYDTDWEKGTENEKHHWVLEPGTSVTSEIGWVIESSERLLAADPTLESRMGSAGPYPLYYHVNEYDGDSETSYFIDLGVKAE